MNLLRVVQPTDALVARLMAPSFIRSVQRDTVTITGSATSGTKTIAAVDLNNALLFMHDLTTDMTGVWSGYNPGDFLCAVELTDATTVTLRRQGTGNGGGSQVIVAGFEVIEYMPGVLKSVQRGVLSVGGTSGTATLSPTVDPARCSLHSLGMTTNATGAFVPGEALMRMTFTDGSTLTGTKNGSTFNCSTYYQVAEWH